MAVGTWNSHGWPADQDGEPVRMLEKADLHQSTCKCQMGVWRHGWGPRGGRDEVLTMPRNGKTCMEAEALSGGSLSASGQDLLSLIEATFRCRRE